MFFIDGEEYPSLNGTGTEDYFNHAWGMQRNAFPFFRNNWSTREIQMDSRYPTVSISRIRYGLKNI